MNTTTMAMGGGLLWLAGAGFEWRAQEQAQRGAEISVVAELRSDATPDTGIERVPVLEAWPCVSVPPVAPLVSRDVDLAICLDTSGSMSGLIEATKQKLWAMVNDLALAEPLPRLRVALLTFGNNGHSPENGWVSIDAGLTEDLDRISERLFALSTDGGEEYVGRVVHTAVTGLEWSTSPGALKLIVVAGNESADQDPLVRYSAASAAAIGRDIMVNAIYCGNPTDELAPIWREVAKLADGQFASIDQDTGTVTVVTPFDVELASLSTALTATYVPFGASGMGAWANQCKQDENALELNSEAAASRAQLKSNRLYKCDWDLVTACADGTLKLAEVPAEDLPEAMRGMTLEQQTAFLGERSTQRAELQAKVDALAVQRQAFIDAELKKQALDESRAFDFVLRRALREQAMQRGFRFPEQALPATEPAVLQPVEPVLAPAAQPSLVPGGSVAPVQGLAPTQALEQQRELPIGGGI